MDGRRSRRGGVGGHRAGRHAFRPAGEGVFQEETAGNLDAAITLYTQITDEAAANRRFVAEALYRFGSCCQKQGKTAEAETAFRQLVALYPDQKELTPKEYALLDYLAGRAGRALTRDDILRSVWGRDVFVTGRSVDRCITTLRQKIEPDPSRPTFIHTLREIGYRFEPGAA